MSLFETVKRLRLPNEATALPGRETAIETSQVHYVNGHKLNGPYPEGAEIAVFGMGCFWGVERLFWALDGVYLTAVGYAGGITPNPNYKEVCSGQTGHNEVVLVVFMPKEITYLQLLEVFWTHHHPAQGMRQGNDTGTQYRSGIYCINETQMSEAKASLIHYQKKLDLHGIGDITTEIKQHDHFYFAEDYHQQYLAKNPGGYCNMQSCDKTNLPEY